MDQGTPTTTPERRPPRWNGHELASFWTRVWASLFDAFLAGAVGILIHAILTGHLFAGRNVSAASQLGFIGIGIVVGSAYYVAQMVRWNGRTIGKRALRIRVVRESAEPMTFRVAFVREILCKSLGFGLIVVSVFVPGLLLVTVIDDLWVLGDRENRALHDIAARTRVIRDAP
jgi:uncharacterized RDD family membrane protein YckC